MPVKLLITACYRAIRITMNSMSQKEIMKEYFE